MRWRCICAWWPGPLRLVGGDFPELAFMLDIARHNERGVLRLLAS
jgi:hypothetical protein